MRPRALAIFGFLAALCFSWPAHAFLGGDESSLDDVRLALSPTSEKLISHETHQIHEFAVGHGIVRAYVSPSGQIFAYTGHGLRNHPDPSLFGSYLSEFQAAAKNSRKHGRHPLSVQTPNIAAGYSGPQGALHWYVYLRSLPPGVTEHDVQ